MDWLQRLPFIWRITRGWTIALGAALVLITATGLGLVTARLGDLAILIAIGILAAGLASADIVLLAVLAFPASLLMIRTGPLSVSDLVLALATLPAILLYRRSEANELQPLLWAGIAYQVLLVPTLVLNPNAANLLEWIHELVLVTGSLLIGWAAGSRSKGVTALNLFVTGGVLIGVVAIVQGVILLARTGSFGPVYLPNLHKNFIGNTLAFVLVMMFVRPDWTGWTRHTSRWVSLVCVLGIAASQSRQAMVSVIATIAILSLRSRSKGGGRGRILLLLFIPAVWFIANSVSDQLDSGNEFSSAAQRLAWFSESLDIWSRSPLFGVGLRWWYTGNYSSFQPPNAFFEMLSSAGILGILGFLLLCATGLWIVFLLPPRFGNLALAVMMARFVQGQLDLYWVAGQAALPWMVAGLVIGVMANEQALGREPRHLPSWKRDLATTRASVTSRTPPLWQQRPHEPSWKRSPTPGRTRVAANKPKWKASRR